MSVEGATGFGMDGGLASVREQLATISFEVENIRSLFLQLDSKVSAESNLRQTLEADFEDRMRSVDWQCYSQELAAACEELQQWRDGIEADRSAFKASLKQELQQELSERGDPMVDSLRKAVAEESREREEAVKRLEQQCSDVTRTMSVEIDSRSTFTQGLREILEAEGDERSRIVTCFNTQRLEVQTLTDDVSTCSKEIQELKVAVGRSIPTTALNLETGEVDVKALQEHWQKAHDALENEITSFKEIKEKGHDALAKEVNILSGQVKEVPTLLLELTTQLHALRHGLTSETNERNIAIDNLARKLELVSTVFNVDSRPNKEDNAEMSSQSAQHFEQQLRLIFDQLDSMANTQLSAVREQVANCSQQLALEQAERKSDSEMVWSSMQSLHGHLVQFISQPPATTYVMPESNRSLGRMPRSRSPSPRIPPAVQEEPVNSGVRPRPQVQLPSAQLPLGSSQLLTRTLPDHSVTLSQGYAVTGRTQLAGGAPLSWNTVPTPQEQNISFARHVLKG